MRLPDGLSPARSEPHPHRRELEKRALARATERRNAVLAAGEHQLDERKEDEKPILVPTLAEFKEAYLRHKRTQRLKASTEAGRELHLQKWILPVLGGYRLDEIATGAIDLLKEAMEEKSEKYVNNVLGTLSNIVRCSKRLRLIREIPVDSFGLFKVDNSKPPPFYSEEEYGRLVDAALQIDLRLAAVILLGGDAGLRSGEIRALPPYCVKWDTKQLHIDRQVWRDVVDSPKSGRGRIIPADLGVDEDERHHQGAGDGGQERRPASVHTAQRGCRDERERYLEPSPHGLRLAQDQDNRRRSRDCLSALRTVRPIVKIVLGAAPPVAPSE